MFIKLNKLINVFFLLKVRSALPGASRCAALLNQSFPVKNYFKTGFSAKIHFFMIPINFPALFPQLLSNTKKYMWMSMTELRSDWWIGYYVLGRDKCSAKTISVNNFPSERVDSKGLYGRWRLRLLQCAVILRIKFDLPSFFRSHYQI